MPKKGYTNLSVDDKLYAKFSRDYDRMIKPRRKISLAQYGTNLLRTAIAREIFLIENYPNLRFVGIIENGCIIEDTRKHEIVKVRIKGKNIVTDKKGDDWDYVFFAIIHPEFKI